VTSAGIMEGEEAVVHRSVLLLSLVLLALACSSPPPEQTTDFDVEIARAAQIGDPVRMREGDEGSPGVASVMFPSDWGEVQTGRRSSATTA